MNEAVAEKCERVALDEGRDDGFVSQVFADIALEALIEIEVVESQLTQIGHRRIAHSKVIDGDVHAQSAKLLHLVGYFGRLKSPCDALERSGIVSADVCSP